jgi:signal transduction histidine kinase
VSIEAAAGLNELLERSWAGRGRAIRGRELRVGLILSGAFLSLAVALALAGDSPATLHPAAIGVVVAFAFATQVEFPIGAAFFVPTQLLLVPLFVVAPAPVVPLLVFAGYALATLGAALTGRVGFDRLVFSASDSIHALGPALVITAFAHGDAAQAGAGVIVLALAAQFAADSVASSLHELVSMGSPGDVHLLLLLRTWGVDIALGSVGLLAAVVAVDRPWAAMTPLLIVVLLAALAADRRRSIDAAHQRLVALEQERGRREAAAQLLEQQNQFLHDVSHELRTPVTIARGHLDTLSRLGGNATEYAVALDELGRIERIIERLLVLARAEGGSPDQRDELDADRFLEDRFVRWSDTVRRPWQLGELAGGTLVADSDALCAALDALIENAVKHTTESQHIRMRSQAIGGWLSIEIADAGAGIPAEALDRIFERFARVDSARNREVGGAGLGLAVVHAVATAHGGTCSVRSSPAGSAFTLRLPNYTAA